PLASLRQAQYKGFDTALRPTQPALAAAQSYLCWILPNQMKHTQIIYVHNYIHLTAVFGSGMGIPSPGLRRASYRPV
ncbi:MAG: hypothetical protein DRQ06_04805, partial [Candidatus Hydrothermota bacterium]